MKLLAAKNTGVPPDTLASSFAMRGFRERTTLAAMALIESEKPRDLRTFTVINANWTVPIAGLASVRAITLKRQFRQHLHRIGALNADGVLFAWLHCELEPTSATYVFHWHGWAFGAKARALNQLRKKRNWGYVPTATNGTPVRLLKVKDLATQLTYAVKAFWPQRTFRESTGARDRTVHRIDEPFHTQALLWLDAQPWSDMAVHTGGWSRRSGGTQPMRDLYFSIFGAGPTVT